MTRINFARRAPLAASAFFITLCAATAAQAQDAPAQPTQTAQDGEEVILVTAQRRTQVLTEVPQSVSVIGGETLDQQNARSFADYAQLVPGLTLTQENPGETRLILRGVNTGSVGQIA